MKETWTVCLVGFVYPVGKSYEKMQHIGVLMSLPVHLSVSLCRNWLLEPLLDFIVATLHGKRYIQRKDKTDSIEGTTGC